MRHGSLFSGIGGFDLAAQWMGWENVFHCEWNEFGRKVLGHYWPKAISYEDIKKTDFTIHRGSIDIITGGFPCQPFSQAGKRKGADDDRYLWPEMLRAIREVNPTWVVGENVAGITNMVLAPRITKVESETLITGAYHNRKMVSESVIMRICEDFESIGYSCQPVLIPACGKNAPHQRGRVWFIAHRDGIRQQRTEESKEVNYKGTGKGMEEGHESNAFHGDGNATNPGSKRSQATVSDRKLDRRQRPSIGSELGSWDSFPTEPPVCGGNDGLPTELDGITFPKWRQKSIKAYGNAIVPQVAFEIFKAIEQTYEKP